MPRSEVDRLTENIALALATIEQEERARVIEECAKVAEGYAIPSDPRMQGGPITYRQPWAIKCAAAIRARAAEKEAK